MKRMLIQLDEEMYAKLRRRAFDEGRSISSVTRELLAKGLGAVRRKKATRVEQFSFVGAGRSKQDRLAPVSERHDDALAAIRRK